MTVGVLAVGATEAERQAAWGQAVRECQEGHPRRYIESYLKINPAAGMERPGLVTRFKFMPTQDTMYARTFGAIRSYGEGFKAVIAKSRDVYATSLFMGAIPFAFPWQRSRDRASMNFWKVFCLLRKLPNSKPTRAESHGRPLLRRKWNRVVDQPPRSLSVPVLSR